MADDKTPVTPEGPEGAATDTMRIEPVGLETEMQRSYLDYAMSVIVSRALPDVRDGLKPVHRRVLYAMYDGGYRPERGFYKCARVVGDVMGTYHPHGDSSIYDALVRLAQPWSMRMPLVDSNGNFGSPGNDPAAAMRYTECKMAPLSMEMVRDIDEETVDFQDNYDGRNQEPTVLPSRFPNLLINGSAGIAVGMATNIPPHNLREVAEGAQWCLANPDASSEELLEALIERIKGPDFPTGALVVGRRGIEEAYRTGRGSITMRAVVEVEEIQGRQCLVVTELPYQVNPDNLAQKIADLVKDGRVGGIADVRDETSSRTGQRLVIVLKRDAVAKVVLNNLYKHTDLQTNFGANMLALVDGVPRTLSLDQFIKQWVTHQIEVIVRRTRFRLRKAEERAHILRGLLKALDAIDEVIALIRRSATVDVAREGLMGLLEIDEIQANAILEMQLRRLAALERQKIVQEHDELQAKINEYNRILASPEMQRGIISTELTAIVEKFGDDRRSALVPFDGDMSIEDLIAEEDIVITISRGGYVKRTKTDDYRSQKRGGKGVRGTKLKEDDIVDHFFVTTTHHWLLFFTNKGRVYRAKAYELPDAGRDARGQHVANLLAFQPDEQIAQVLAIRDYNAAPYLVLATRSGLVKKTSLKDYDSPRSGGVIAINLRETEDGGEDLLIGAELVGPDDDLLLVSRKAQSIRFTATDDALRPMGRATSGVKGMSFREGDELLSMNVVRPGTFVFTATDGGYAKRTSVDEYRVQGRGGLGIKAAKIVEDRGSLVGALVVEETDEILAITLGGGVIRTRVNEIRETGRDTMGVQLINLGKKDAVVGIARNAEAGAEAEEVVAAEEAEGEQPAAAESEE
ncbi:DNA gyrase subunit A [Streptomyces sp. NPDC088354]|uniref:DNA gyrase subunit A n=1 Tax=unclassified Streptomyces TaxID=2593676 RepID=UPI0029A0ACE9|nr:DNA gyrase subunit A [Streptomyces sp. MI02-7b]MDX3076358.1 DNA gyrase subunit A [Streptomyces sp. MI02-7b]